MLTHAPQNVIAAFMKPLPIVQKAIAAVGSSRKLGLVLDVDHSSVVRWRSVPLEYLKAIERLTGVDRRVIRPDVPWPDGN